MSTAERLNRLVQELETLPPAEALDLAFAQARWLETLDPRERELAIERIVDAIPNEH